ncbi:hypothetical protein AVEN_258328-1, partial [Araneus ventricosus]
MAAAIFIRVVSRYGKVTTGYWMKPLTPPPGGERVDLALISLKRYEIEKKSDIKVVQHYRFSTKRHLDSTTFHQVAL